MGQQHGWRLKRLGSLKIFIVLSGRTVEGGEPVEAGSVVIYRRNAKRPNVYATIYDAWRSRLEIVGRYGADGREAGEIAELDESRQRLRQAGLGLRDEDGGAAGGRVTRRIGRVALDLKCKSNPLKSEARLKAKAGPVRTAKNRKVNRMATQARVTAIDSRLAERQEEIYSILPWIQAMETALRLEIDRSLGVIGRLARDCGSVISGHEFFRTGRTTPNQLQGLAARLRLLQGDLGALCAAPFLAAGQGLAAGLEQAIGQVRLGRSRPAARALAEVRARCGRVLLQRQVEELLAAASPADGGILAAGAVSELARRVGKLLERLADPRRSAAAAEAAKHLGSALAALDAYRVARQDGQAEQAGTQLEEFRQALKEASLRLAR